MEGHNGGFEVNEAGEISAWRGGQDEAFRTTSSDEIPLSVTGESAVGRDPDETTSVTFRAGRADVTIGSIRRTLLDGIRFGADNSLTEAPAQNGNQEGGSDDTAPNREAKAPSGDNSKGGSRTIIFGSLSAKHVTVGDGERAGTDYTDTASRQGRWGASPRRRHQERRADSSTDDAAGDGVVRGRNVEFGSGRMQVDGVETPSSEE